jgi:hypothetical protein
VSENIKEKIDKLVENITPIRNYMYIARLT